MNVTDASEASESQELELNLAPVVDCLTVLIAFLLVSASFFAIGLFDAGIASAPEPSVPMSAKSIAATNQPALLIRLGSGGQVDLTVNRGAEGGNHRLVAPGERATRDLDGMLAAVRKLREKDPAIREAVLGADPGVEYQEMVRAIEVLHQELPQVYLGG